VEDLIGREQFFKLHTVSRITFLGGLKTKHFIEFTDVPVFDLGNEVGVLCKDSLFIFPRERLYEVEAKGEMKDDLIERMIIQSADSDKTFEATKRALKEEGQGWG
jgi:hypothetical protein